MSDNSQDLMGESFITRKLATSDPEVAAIISEELKRQEYGLEMIPSENFVSHAVMEAVGSVLTNKYAEGLPNKRYYGGCQYVDQVEQLAINRVCKIFGATFANVQPHSGAQANQAAFESVLKPGDVVMGMRLDMGGHLTHGSPVNFSGKHYRVVAYSVTRDSHLIDMDEVMAVAKEHRPKMIICGASAYSRRIDFAAFRKVADEVGAILMADIAHYAGLVAVGEYPTPFGSADIVTTTTHKTLRGPRGGVVLTSREDLAKVINKCVFPGLQGGPLMHVIAGKAVAFGEVLNPGFKSYAAQTVKNARLLAAELINLGVDVVSGGTDSHLLVIDLRKVGVSGKDAQHWFDEVGITANKNTIPYDPQPPTVCSGIRLGTPALTTRGMKEAEMKLIAGFIIEALESKGEALVLSKVKKKVEELSRDFPLYIGKAA